MDKFLIELVRLNGSAILPDFGALSIADESTGELMFNEYLKFNDGKLTQLVVENSSMDEQEAQNSIAKYVRDIRIQLDKGDSYDIFGIGSFKKDNDGAIIFEGSLSGKEKKEDVILGPSPTPTAVSEPVIIETNKVQENTEESLEEPTNTEQEKPEVIAVTTDTPPPTKESTKHKTEKLVKSPKSKKEKSKKKKGGLFYLLLFLLVAIAGGGTYVGLNYDEVKSYFGWDKFDEIESVAGLIESELIDTDDSNDNIAEDDSSPADDDVWADDQVEEDIEELVEAESTPAPAPKPAPQPTQSVNTSGTPFHLIGGSFSERGNAENFVSDMQAKGYPSHIVGEFNGMHMVSVKSFSTREDAMREISTIQNDAPKAWLFKHPK